MTKTMIKNGLLIDGNGGEPMEQGAVVIDGNRIVFVGDAADFDGTVDETMDVDGATIAPGFIDTHVHLMMEYSSVQNRLETPFSYMFYQAINYMRNTLNAGITSVRDALGTDLGVKKAVEEGIVEGPRMQLSINALTITGGHGDGYTQPQGKPWNFSRLITLECQTEKQTA